MFIVLTYVSTIEQARHLVDLVLSAGRVVCANIGVAVESHYVWKTERCQESEVPIWMKVREDQVLALRAILAAEHPYEVPIILDWPVRVNKSYADWAQSLGNE